MVYDEYRKTAVEMIMAGVKAADPTEAVTRNVTLAGDALTICDLRFTRSQFDRILLFSVGKASVPMARAFECVLRPDEGLVISKIGSEIDAANRRALFSATDACSLRATKISFLCASNALSGVLECA